MNMGLATVFYPRLTWGAVIGGLICASVAGGVACRVDEPTQREILNVADALQVQEELFRFHCECYAQFDELTAEICASGFGEFSAAEVACVSEVFDGDAESFEILRCQAEAMAGLLECKEQRDCPAAVMCDDGTMIAESWICDGLADCTDGSDEGDRCLTAMCANGERLVPEWVCDEYVDCADGSDEIGCPPPFMCTDGQWIPGAWVCNETVDCPDGSDEDQLGCPETCERPWLLQEARCGELSSVITTRFEACVEFVCLDGEVIDPSYRCDGDEDCAEGEDEASCDERKHEPSEE